MPRLNIAPKETSLKRVKKMVLLGFFVVNKSPIFVFGGSAEVYHKYLVALAQIILFFKMLKSSKKSFLSKNYFSERKWKKFKNIQEYSNFKI